MSKVHPLLIFPMVLNIKVTRIHYSRMRTARSLTVSRNICHPRPPRTPPPAMHTPPAMHALLSCTPPTPPTTHTPSPGMPPAMPPSPITTHAPPRTETLTHATQNITLPQASFAGGNKRTFQYTVTFIITHGSYSVNTSRTHPISRCTNLTTLL